MSLVFRVPFIHSFCSKGGKERNRVREIFVHDIYSKVVWRPKSYRFLIMRRFFIIWISLSHPSTLYNFLSIMYSYGYYLVLLFKKLWHVASLVSQWHVITKIKAGVKRRTSHEPDRMLMKLNGRHTMRLVPATSRRDQSHRVNCQPVPATSHRDQSHRVNWPFCASKSSRRDQL